MAPAMIAAVDFVQSRADLMPGFVLKLTIVDSKCDAGESCFLVYGVQHAACSGMVLVLVRVRV